MRIEKTIIPVIEKHQSLLLSGRFKKVSNAKKVSNTIQSLCTLRSFTTTTTLNGHYYLFLNTVRKFRWPVKVHI